jgi:periplasmic divalent cation tolerance protein
VTGIVSVYATFGTDEEARRIGVQVVGERLAACVNVLGACHSIYRWQGKVEEAGEVAALFKTAAGKAEALVVRIGELHSYDTPAAVVWPIAGAPEAYAAWVLQSTR